MKIYVFITKINRKTILKLMEILFFNGNTFGYSRNVYNVVNWSRSCLVKNMGEMTYLVPMGLLGFTTSPHLPYKYPLIPNLGFGSSLSLQPLALILSRT